MSKKYKDFVFFVLVCSL